MRVIAGSAGGIPISVPNGLVRPTMDKVRAAIFSSLGDAVPGSRVLDLFAGSGGLGIEALSRGAASAIFVDDHAKAGDCIRRNLSKARLEASVQTMDAFRFLSTYAIPGSLDLVFADPPYEKYPGDPEFVAPLLRHPGLIAAMAADGILVLEMLAGNPLPDEAAAVWRSIRSRDYGESAVHFLVRVE